MDYANHWRQMTIDRTKRNPAKFKCEEGPSDPVNDGYGPIVDAFYNAMKTVDMLLDPNWGNLEKEVIPLVPIGLHYLDMETSQDNGK